MYKRQIVTCALLNDGVDYPFEINYMDAFSHALEGIREAAEYRKDVKISLEYKQSEPRVHCLLNNAGKMAYFADVYKRQILYCFLLVCKVYQENFMKHQRLMGPMSGINGFILQFHV